MKTKWLRVIALSAFLTLAVSGTAWAHVTVQPEEVPAGGFQTMVVTVPTEKEIPTTEVRVEVPEGFTVSRVQPVPGWDYEFEEEGGLVTGITWSGGELGPTEFQQFPISAQTPQEPGEYAWRAFQTYEDGSVVDWAGPPDSEEPASVVEVVSSGSETDGHGGTGGTQGESEASNNHAEVSGAASAEDALPETGGSNTIISIVATGVGVLAVGLALMALLRRRER